VYDNSMTVIIISHSANVLWWK